MFIEKYSYLTMLDTEELIKKNRVQNMLFQEIYLWVLAFDLRLFFCFGFRDWENTLLLIFSENWKKPELKELTLNY